jgi:molybdopterin synthase sulfur carrier subunit
MDLKVLFFGATADIVGNRELHLELAAGEAASFVFKRIVAEYPLLSRHKLHFAINQQFATGNEIVRDGDELAIFTAVSGG